MVLVEQIIALLDYLEEHRELAQGHFSRTMEGRALAKKQWAQCAVILNSVTEDCPNKTAAEWRVSYNEYKAKIFKKIKVSKQEMNSSGNSATKKYSLTPLQVRLCDILENDVGEPIVEVHNPLSPAYTSPSLDVEINLGTDNNCDSRVIEHCQLDCESPPIEQKPEPNIPPPPNIQIQPPKRLRQKRARGEDRDRSALEASQARLERIELKAAEASMARARATESLALAVEKLGAATEEASRQNKTMMSRAIAAVDRVGDLISLFLAPQSAKTHLAKKKKQCCEMNNDSDLEESD